MMLIRLIFCSLALLLKEHSYEISIFFNMLWRSAVRSTAVLPTHDKTFRPDQLKSSAAGEKVRPHLQYSHRG
jgi:hypothetical protein